MSSCGGGGNTNPSDNNGYDASKPWQLVWEDDFNHGTLNTEDWSPAVQGLNYNNEDQAYIAENVGVDPDYEVLALIAKKEHWEGLSGRADNPTATVSQEYTSGEANTKRSWKYGKFEVRAQFPTTPGILSAVWMTPLDKSWPPEIDIVEMLGHDPSTLYFTNHYGTAENHQKQSNHYVGDDFSGAFHTYSVEWEPGVIRWYVDGVKRYESRTGIPDKPFILRISLPVGPDWEGNPTESSVFPVAIFVDWVRVYQRG